MAATTLHPDSPDTKVRLLTAAAQVFGTRGFRRTTVREICRLAEANLASVNYHFRDKVGLYLAVLEEMERRALEKYPLEIPPEAGAPERLRRFIEHLIFKLFDEDLTDCRFRIMAWETLDPTPALDTLVARVIQPMSQRLQGIIQELLGPAATVERVRLCQLSIIGQCLHHRQAQAVISRLFPKQGYAPADLRQIAAHITQFSLQALRGLAQEAEATS